MVKYEVERILARRFIFGKEQFLLKWKGYGRKEASWENKKDLHCPALLREFQKRENEKLNNKNRNSRGKRSISIPDSDDVTPNQSKRRKSGNASRKTPIQKHSKSTSGAPNSKKRRRLEESDKDIFSISIPDSDDVTSKQSKRRSGNASSTTPIHKRPKSTSGAPNSKKRWLFDESDEDSASSIEADDVDQPTPKKKERESGKKPLVEESDAYEDDVFGDKNSESTFGSQNSKKMCIDEIEESIEDLESPSIPERKEEENEEKPIFGKAGADDVVNVKIEVQDEEFSTVAETDESEEAYDDVAMKVEMVKTEEEEKEEETDESLLAKLDFKIEVHGDEFSTVAETDESDESHDEVAMKKEMVKAEEEEKEEDEEETDASLLAKLDFKRSKILNDKMIDGALYYGLHFEDEGHFYVSEAIVKEKLPEELHEYNWIGYVFKTENGIV